MDKNAKHKKHTDEKQDDVTVETTENVEEVAVAEEPDEYKTKYLRALADYQNFERRVREDRIATSKNAQAATLMRLLPFLDNLEQAEIFIQDKGLKMIKEQFYSVLKEMGLEEIEVAGKEYDPHLAEAIDIVEGEKDDHVVEVLRRGYMCGGKILRPAQVKVSKKIEKGS